MQSVQQPGMGMPTQGAPMAGYGAPAGANIITTELIQKYLDENKQLILAILDNQNLGKLNECAQYQQRLQQNLMYLAAIADAQPQLPPPATTSASPAMQPQPQQYVQQPAIPQQAPVMMQQAPPQQQHQQPQYGAPQPQYGAPQQQYPPQGQVLMQQQPMMQGGPQGMDTGGGQMVGDPNHVGADYGSSQVMQNESQQQPGVMGDGQGYVQQQPEQQQYEMHQQQGMVPQSLGHEGMDAGGMMQGNPTDDGTAPS